MKTLTVEQVLVIHYRMREATGGAAGVLDPGRIDAALARPNATYGGRELYPTIAEKAAALLISMIRNHPFVDANKRVGTATMLIYLRLHGIVFIMPHEELIELAVQIANDLEDVATVAAILDPYLEPAP